MRLEIPGFSRYYLETEDNRIYNNHGHQMCECTHYNRYGKHPTRRLSLINDQGIPKSVLKHRLVYMAYHHDEDISELQINHLDEDSMNNSIDNLETCTNKENMNWGTVGQRISMTTKGRINNHRSRPVVAYVLDEYDVEHYPSIAEACRRFGKDSTNIIDCCKGRRVDYLGRIWQYE